MWKDNANNEIGYKIDCGSIQRELPKNIQSYKLTQLKANTQYTCSVVAYHKEGNSDIVSIDFQTDVEKKFIITSPKNATSVKAGENVTIE